MRVLVVDDAAVSRAAFVRMARHVGFDVVGEAADPKTGLALAARERPDAVVVDGRLVADVVASFVEPLRAADPAVSIVVIAALRETALVRSALEAGASGALLRPFRPSQIGEALRAACERTR